jgi:hypothetical protein
MASSFATPVHDILLSLVASFPCDQVEAIVKSSRNLSWHSYAMVFGSDLAEHHKLFMFNVVQTP